MPGAVSRTSTYALNATTLVHAKRIAKLGWKGALKADPNLLNGLMLVNERNSVFKAMPVSRNACAELRNIICLEADYDISGDDHPLIEVASHIQEDLCVLQKRGDAHVLTAAVICFPSSWDVREKIGRSIENWTVHREYS